MTEAAAQFDQVRATDKDYPGLSLERGLLFEESGNTEKALDEFKAALAKAPDDPDLMLRVGAAYVAIGKGAEGLPMLRKVLEKRANSAEANHYLGRALFAQNGGGNAESMRYLRRATELDSNRAEYHMYVAWAANESNNREALGIARDEIEKAYALDKLNGDVFWQRGSLERKQGAVEDAERDLKRALQLKPSRIEAHAALAECYEDKNEVAAALDEWQKAVIGNDSVTSWRYRFGKLLLERGNAAEAAKHLGYAAQQADKMEIRPGWFSDLQFQAAEAFKRAGQRKEAIERFKKFLEVAPTNSPDRRDAVRALGELGAP
jgi:tetratricopeptide (TPR) repeat protein